jgi:hypothetical protein
MIGFIAPYTFTQFGTTVNYSAIAILQNFQFIFTQPLGFSVFNSRILATDLSQSRCNFTTHMKSSSHRLIPFLPFFSVTFHCNLQNSTQSSRLLSCTPSRLLTAPFYNPSARTPRKTPCSSFKDACLLVRYVAVDVLVLSRAHVLRECVYRAVS